MNSRNKGKRIELEACKALRALGLQAERTVQHEGRGSAGDIRVFGTTLHAEVKGRATITACRFMDQAIRDCRRGATPAVLMRENRGPFLLLCRLQDIPALVEQWLAGRAHGESNEADGSAADAAGAYGALAGHAATGLELR